MHVKAAGPAPASTLSPAVQTLRQVPLLSGLDEPTLIELSRHVIFRKFGPSQVLYRQQDKAEHLIVLIAGKLQMVSLSEDGRPMGAQVLNPGEFIGELSVIDSQPRSETLVSVSESIVALIPASVALQLFVAHPLVTHQVMQHMCKSIRQVTQIRSVLAVNRAHMRVYHLLLKFAKPAPNASLTIEGLPNQQTIAMMANVSRESVSRAIHALIRQNILRKDARRLVVTSPDALNRLARGEVDSQSPVDAKA
jgi:CRP/FNR family cyclic AMP-dependent transcriptional regulator